MAKFRRNHTKSGNFLSSSFARLAAFIFLGGFAIYYITRTVEESENLGYEVPVASNSEERYFLPIGSTGEIVHHDYYSLSYSEKFEQAEWVAYELSKQELKLPNVKREREFRPDYDVSTGSAFHRDYTRSGYTRGHLAPAGDMAFSTEAMKQSFFMSNMSPQLESFNGGAWRELEENVRDWAYDNNRLFIVTGPILNAGIIKKIGDNGVAVPKYFFKVILEISGQDKKGIGFVMKNEMLESRLEKYAMSIDSVEAITGFDFFDGLLTDDLEEAVESELDVKSWRFKESRYRTRNNRYR